MPSAGSATCGDTRWLRGCGARTVCCASNWGLVRFGFRLRVRDGGIEWTVERVRALGVPLPARWFSGVRARESAQGERYAFDVQAALPVIGPLVHYRGWLDVA